jgi:hypothetical protein
VKIQGRSLVAVVHTFLVGLTAQAIGLLPRRVHAAMDAWSRRVARNRALQRQRAGQRKR